MYLLIHPLFYKYGKIVVMQEEHQKMQVEPFSLVY